MSTTEKSATLAENAKQAIDAIVNDPEIDDDKKEEILEELLDHLEDGQRILSDEDHEDEDEEDEENDGDDEAE